MKNHKEDLRLIAETIIKELEYNSIHKHETKKEINDKYSRRFNRGKVG